MGDKSEDSAGLISTLPASGREHRALLVFVVCSAALFLTVAPLAKREMPHIPNFIALYLSAVCVVDVITAALLLGQHIILRNKALLALACGYIFNLIMAAAQGLSFPGLLAPQGLIGNGSNTTAWLYFLWHGGFPLFVGAYTLFHDEPQAPADVQENGRGWRVAASIVATLAFAALLIAMASEGSMLPDIMRGDADGNTKIGVAAIVWGVTAVALVGLWRRRPHRKLDLGLIAVLSIWLFDLALSAVLNHARYDVGWYAGRIYGVVASSFVLVVLLLENSVLYARLTQAHAREQQERRRVVEKSAKLDASNAALQDSAARIQSILDTAADGIITIDAHGRIESVNPAVQRLFGYSMAELLGRNVSILMPEPDKSRHDQYLVNYLGTFEPRIIGTGREVTGRKQDGSTFPMSLSVSEMWISGERHFTGIVSDITERKKNEDRLIAAKDMAERANAVKSSFLATMSHEIRTPLGGLLGMLELLNFSKLDQEQKSLLETAIESGRSLLRIVNDILDWSKIEEGKLEIAPTPTSIAALVADVHITYSHVASGNNVLLTHATDSRLSASHLVDRLRLSQILNNFVSNAIKFSRGGRVELRADLVSRLGDHERVRFSVTDTGIGIAPQAQDMLFQNYGQASVDTARIYGGTGLGLAICRRLADLMDARIDLDSAVGRGSVFSVTLSMPTVESDSQSSVIETTSDKVTTSTVPIALHTGDGLPIEVLVVDDNPTNRKLLALQLERLGLLATIACDGASALSLWQARHFKLVITDCHMPVLDGYALAQAIRQAETDAGRARTPILAWTANALRNEEQKCLQAGMDAILVKPVDISTLERVLPKFLPHHAQDISRAAEVVAPEQPAHLDLEFLSLQVGREHAVMREFLLDFQTVANSIARELASAWSRRDTQQCVALGHKLKSSARAVGAQMLGDICARIETAGLDAELDTLNDLHAQFALELELVGQLVNAHLSTQASREKNNEPAV